MFVSDWMTTKVYTASPDECVANAVKMMRELKIHHVPIAVHGRLKGIVSDKDIKEYFPSRTAKAGDLYELNYLLEKTSMKDVMKKKVLTTTPETPIEDAAMMMYDERVGCLPVIKDDLIVGIISDRDIFRALIDITGVRKAGHRVFLVVDSKPRGAIKEIADIIRKHGFGIQSILTSHQKAEKGYRNVVIRTSGAGQFGALKAELMGSYRDVKFRKAAS